MSSHSLLLRAASVAAIVATSAFAAQTVANFSEYSAPYVVPADAAILGSGNQLFVHYGRPSYNTTGVASATISNTGSGNRLVLATAVSGAAYSYVNSPAFDPTTLTSSTGYGAKFRITSTTQNDRIYFGLYAGSIASSVGYNLDYLGNSSTTGLAQSRIGLAVLLQGGAFRVVRTSTSNTLQSWSNGAWVAGLANSGAYYSSNVTYETSVVFDPISGLLTLGVRNADTGQQLLSVSTLLTEIGSQGRSGGLHLVFGDAANNAAYNWTIETSELSIGVKETPPRPPAPGENFPAVGYLNVAEYAANAGIAGVDLASAAAASANHSALQAAVNFAVEHRLVAYFPAGTYYIDRTLRCETYFLVGTSLEIDGQKAELVGSTSGAARPIIKVPPGSPFFANPPTPVVYFLYHLSHKDANGNEIDVEDPDADQTFYNRFRDIDIDTGGNPGAVGIKFDAAQDSVVQNSRIVATGSYAGVYGVPNHGSGGIVNIEVEGGNYGVYHYETNTADYTDLVYNSGAPFVGLKLRNQTVSAIYSNHFVPITVVGFHIYNSSAHPALHMVGGTLNFSTINLIDGIIEVTDPTQPAISNNSFANGTPPRNLYLRNVYVTGTDKLVAYKDWTDPTASTKPDKVTTLAGAAPWRRIEEYAFCPPGAYTVDSQPVQSFNVVDGIVDQFTERIAASLTTYVPGDLLTRHLPRTLPTIDWLLPGSGATVHVFTLSNPAGLNNSYYDAADELQAAIDTHGKIYLPPGHYYVGHTITLDADTVLFGAGRALTQIRTKPSWNPTAPVPVVTTVDDANAAIYFGDLSIGLEMLDLANAWFTALEWRAGRYSTVNVGRVFYSSAPPSWDLNNPDWWIGQPIDLLRITGNGGGRWYFPGSFERTRNDHDAFRQLRILGTHEPLSIYGLNLEHARGSSMGEIGNSANIRIYTLKTEFAGDIGNEGHVESDPSLTVRDTTNFLLVGSGAQRSGPGDNRGTVEFFFSDATSYGAIAAAVLPQAAGAPNYNAGMTVREQIGGNVVGIGFLNQLALYARNRQLVDDNAMHYIPPTVSVTAPSGGTTFPAFPTTLAATATDSDGGVAVVEFAVNGTVVADDTSSPYTATWLPTAAGAYAITATATDSDFVSTTSSAVQVTVTNSVPSATALDLARGTVDAPYEAVLNGSGGDGALTWSASGPLPAGLALTPAGVLRGVPAEAGTFAVSATVADSDGIAGPADETTRSYELVIEPAVGTLTLTNLAQTYDGTPKSVAVTTSPANLTAVVTYNGSTALPVNAGTYTVVATLAEKNYIGSASGTLVIDKAPASLALGALTPTYDGTPKPATATTAPAGLTVDLTYDGATAAPTDAGSYAVSATINEANYTGTATGTLVIAKAQAAIALGGLAQTYDGTPKSVAVTTSPANLVAVVTYNGSASLPVYPGNYSVAVTLVEKNYVGTANATLEIVPTALVRHAPSIDGVVDGSLQVLSAESFALNGSARISGDLLVPGSPTVQENGKPAYGGAVDGPGSAAPSNFTVTLNGGATLSRLVRRIDPIALPSVALPPAPTGTRDVTLNDASQTAGDFATLRNLTLNGNAGAVAVPAGTYGSFTANGGSSFILGVAGATTPAVYNLQNLTLNGSSQLQIVGPVVVILANGTAINGTAGNAAHPGWLDLRLAAGDLTVNGGAAVYAAVTAPAGAVTLNARLTGRVAADRLSINGSGAFVPSAP